MAELTLKSFVCPHCHERLIVKCELTGVDKYVEAPNSEKPEPGPASRFSKEEQSILDTAKNSGLLEPFTNTVINAAASPEQVPRDMNRFFLSFIKGIQPKAIPRDILRILIREYAGGQIECWGHNTVMAILVDRRIRMFVPYSTLRGTRVKKISGKGGTNSRHIEIGDAEVKLNEWVRTRFGYVEGEGEMLTNLRRHSFGEFARPGM